MSKQKLDRVYKRRLNGSEREDWGGKVVPNFGIEGNGWKGSIGRDLDHVGDLGPERGDKEGRGVSKVRDVRDSGEKVLI